MARTQKLTILNLDSLVEKVIEAGGEVIEDISNDQIEWQLLFYDQGTLSQPTQLGFTHDQYFALFKFVAEKPARAVETLRMLALGQVKTKEDLKYLHEAQMSEKGFVKKAKKDLLENFKGYFTSGPGIYAKTSANLMAVVEDNYDEALKLFKQGYEEIKNSFKKTRFYKDPSMNEFREKIQTIIDALDTRDFSKRGEPRHLELKIVPKEETIEIPKDIDITDHVSLSKYLMETEGAKPENIGIISNRAILIPIEGKKDWCKGLYIVSYKRGNLFLDGGAKTFLDNVYKTEKNHPDKELVLKTVEEGKVIRAGECREGYSKETEIIY